MFPAINTCQVSQTLNSTLTHRTMTHRDWSQTDQLFAQHLQRHDQPLPQLAHHHKDNNRNAQMVHPTQLIQTVVLMEAVDAIAALTADQAQIAAQFPAEKVLDLKKLFVLLTLTL